MKQGPHPPIHWIWHRRTFFLFASIKDKLMRCHAGSLSELFVRIRAILSEVSQEILNAVFLERMERLQKCIDTNGEYFG
jgi:hypothetical protein